MNEFDDILRGTHKHEPPRVSRGKIKKALKETPLPTGDDMGKNRTPEQIEEIRRQSGQRYIKEALSGGHRSPAAIAAGDQEKAALAEQQALANHSKPKRWWHLRNK